LVGSRCRDRGAANLPQRPTARNGRITAKGTATPAAPRLAPQIENAATATSERELEHEVRAAERLRAWSSAHLLELLGENDGAIEAYQTAARLTTSRPERDYLLRKAAAITGQGRFFHTPGRDAVHGRRAAGAVGRTTQSAAPRQLNLARPRFRGSPQKPSPSGPAAWPATR
jgi:hypothetical protein